MVYKIGICDDQKLHLKINELYIQEFIERYGYKAQITSFQTYTQIIEEVKKENFHILFLDIDLGKGTDCKENGIMLARKIFKENTDSIIVFITGHKEFAKEAMVQG